MDDGQIRSSRVSREGMARKRTSFKAAFLAQTIPIRDAPCRVAPRAGPPPRGQNSDEGTPAFQQRGEAQQADVVKSNSRLRPRGNGEGDGERAAVNAPAALPEDFGRDGPAPGTPWRLLKPLPTSHSAVDSHP